MGIEISNPVTAVLEIGSKIIDRIWPDPATRDAAKLELYKAQQAGDLAEAQQVFELAKAQIGVNTVEASSSSKWVSGARPFIMWVCGVSLLYSALLEPLMRFVATVCFSYMGNFPVINTDLTMQLLFGLLGLGGYRTYERIKGVIPNGK